MCRISRPLIGQFCLPKWITWQICTEWPWRAWKGWSCDLNSICLQFSSVLSSSDGIFCNFQDHYWCQTVMKTKYLVEVLVRTRKVWLDLNGNTRVFLLKKLTLSLDNIGQKCKVPPEFIVSTQNVQVIGNSSVQPVNL